MKKYFMSIWLGCSVVLLLLSNQTIAETSADLPIEQPLIEHLTEHKQTIQLPRKTTLRAQNANQPTNMTGQTNTRTECTKNVRLIFDDVNKKNASNGSGQNNLTWANLGWLQSTFGAPNISNSISQTIMQWDNFNVIVRNGMVIDTKGKYPGQTLPPDNLIPVFLTKATREIGPPTNTQKENLTQFVWNCADSPSSVSILTDDQGVVMGVIGTYCSRAAGCKNFNLGITDSSLTKKLSNQ